MEYYKDYFKNRKEVEEFFKHESLKFSFRSDNELFFKTLNPVEIDGEFYNFEFSFYDEGEDFFNYTKFSEWLFKFKLATVTCILENDDSRVELYFDKFK